MFPKYSPRSVFKGAIALTVLAALAFGLCPRASASDRSHAILISIPDQKLVVLENGVRVAAYPVSTSRYGVGDRFGSYTTPTGWLEIARKIGRGIPLGGVFKNRQFTGEVLAPNARGRDPIVTRILWLRGLDGGTRNAFARKIYIHGTPVERLIGHPASYGCIRMRSRDVVELFKRVEVGAKVNISNASMRQTLSALAESGPQVASAG